MQLQELKKTYDACLLSKESYAHLLRQREEIHDEIVRLKEKIEAALFKQKESSRKMEALFGLKEKLIVIDHQIDELGEQQGEKLAQVKKELVAAIHKTFPESAELYQQLCQKRHAHLIDEKNCITLCEYLRSFTIAMNEGAAAKRSRGFLRILVGYNEKVILARVIRKATIEAERIYKQINDESFRDFLSTFLEEANRPWNSSLYRERFYELHHQFTQLMKEVEERKMQSKRHALQAEKEIEIWIEHYCKKA